MSSGNPRLGNIGAILGGGAPRQRLTAIPTSEQIPEEEPMTTASEEVLEPVAPSRGHSSAEPERASSGKVARVPVGLDPDLRNRLVAEARRRDAPLAAVVLDAIEKTHTSGTLARWLSSRSTIRRGMFAGTKQNLSARAKTTVELRIPADDAKIIASLVEEHGAKDRTALIIAALEADSGEWPGPV